MIKENDTEAWGYIAGAVNDIYRQLDGLKEMIMTIEARVPKVKTKEEIAEIRRENLKKAREARKAKSA